MKKTIISGIIGLLLGVLVPQTLQAQGTTYLSNLDQASIGSLAVGSNSWAAAIFTVGPNSGGYLLDSIELALSNASGNPGDLRVMIYAGGIGAPLPLFSLGTLSGSLEPVTAGLYTYTPTAPITLTRNSPYSIVLTSDTAIADGTYQWSYAAANSYNPTGGWSTLPTAVAGAWTSINGKPGSWILNGSAFPQFSIEATAVPEPGVLTLFALGGLHLVWRRGKSKAI